MNKFEEILEDPDEEKYGNLKVTKPDEIYTRWPDEKLKEEIKNLEREIDQAVANFPRDLDEDGQEAGAVEEMIRRQGLLKSELQSREE